MRAAKLAGANERHLVRPSTWRLFAPARRGSNAMTIPRVALMHVGTDHLPPSLDTLVARLVELGWIDGPQDELMAKLTSSGRARSPRIELLWRNLEQERSSDRPPNSFTTTWTSSLRSRTSPSPPRRPQRRRPEDRIPVVFLHPSIPSRRPRREPVPPGREPDGGLRSRDPSSSSSSSTSRSCPV